jgi:hypothetical protein
VARLAVPKRRLKPAATLIITSMTATWYQIPIPAHGKILESQAEWWGYADMAEAALKSLKGNIRKAFTIDAQ